MNLTDYSQTVLRESCVLWPHGKNAKGYGVATHQYKYKKAVLAHRLAYARANKITLDSIKGKYVMHLCDNPACVNADHLVLGTAQNNSDDMRSKGRARYSTVTRNQGETCGTSKYTAELVKAIRAEVTLTIPEIARKYNIPRTTASGIWHRHTWKHIA